MPSGPELGMFKKASWLRIPHFWVKGRKTPMGPMKTCFCGSPLSPPVGSGWAMVGATAQETGQQNEGSKTSRQKGGGVFLSKYVCSRVTSRSEKRVKERKARMLKRKWPRIGGVPFYQIVLNC